MTHTPHLAEQIAAEIAFAVNHQFDEARIDGDQEIYPDAVIEGIKEHLREVGIVATLQQYERVLAALRDIAIGNGVPDELLASKEAFREGFASFLQKRAKDTIAALDAAAPETKE